ncbi:MAG: redoxin domain-containing protein [Flavobacteriales bacterium]|jgi:peroxiredoxin 2/4|nr:redoxin domain-containing protein [Flavobacteriales bacterium]
MSVLVGRKAPQFNAQAVVNGGEFVENFSLDQYLDKKYVVLFFYPKDFTFVCPTELHAFQENLARFQERNVAVVAVSTDTEQSHWGWLQVPKAQGGIQGVTYPIVADTNKTISKNYDVLTGDYYYDEDDQFQADNELIAYRGLFLIDKEGVVRHQLVNDLPLGRNVEEVIRMVDALQFNEENGEACPANWNSSKDGLKATHDGVADYLSKN